jgi:hypothetical protein
LGDCRRVWRDSAYADMHGELLALMQKFELCYRLPDAKTETWLAPQLLPPSKPFALTGWELPGDLLLRYRYLFMPKGLISRLMVRLHRFVPRPELGWGTGVLFERETTQVLVEIPPQGGEIALRARGPERKELLSVIAADLDALNDSFHRLSEKVEKLVPCNCPQCRASANPRAYELRELLRRKDFQKFKLECPESFLFVDVLELLDGIQVKSQPVWANMKKIFICYSQKDETHKNNLLEHLSSLRDKIVTWNDKDLLPGEQWDDRIKQELNAADIVLYLVSSSSMATAYIQNTELPLIEARSQAGACKLVPVIVRPCDWTSLDFAKYNALPDKGKPVTSWDDQDEAWLKVVQGIKRLV